MVILTEEPLDSDALAKSACSNAAGAVCVFTGTVRDTHKGKSVRCLDYEAYGPMAERKMVEIEAAMRERWPVVECVLAHRTGHLVLGEASVVVAVSCPHRADAFEACRFGIDAIKADVPIWEKETFADGSSEWVDPTAGAE